MFIPKTIYIDKNIYKKESWKNKLTTILSKYEEASTKEVDSHWNIKEIASLPYDKWIKSKREILVLGIKKDCNITENGRSTDFIFPAHANGCLSSCSYCFTQRRKQGANPLSIFLNTEELIESVIQHQKKIGPKITPNQTDPNLWTYEIGNNNDCSLDQEISGNPLEIIKAISEKTDNAKTSFATKTVSSTWLTYNPKGKSRIRYSLMPQNISSIVDIGTSKISERIQSVNNLVENGYEVHFNFSPVIIYENYLEYWKQLFEEINDTLNTKSKNQLKCEVIFLTHSEYAHKINLEWHPNGENYIWKPDIQQIKFNKPDVICYRYDIKRKEVDNFTRLIGRQLPYCQVRYAF